MKRYRGWLILLLFLALCAGGTCLILRTTAEYPPPGEPVSYPVNQADGFKLTIEEPVWSPFTGYTIRWNVEADSDKVYTFADTGDPGFELLERCVGGQWFRLEHTRERQTFHSLEFTLGGEESTGLGGSLVQKYDDYGTRLEEGTYRLTLEMTAEDGTPYYLAAEFEVK